MDLSSSSDVLSYLAQTLEAKGIMFILQKSLVQGVRLGTMSTIFQYPFPAHPPRCCIFL